jgi:hypothetical protein
VSADVYGICVKIVDVYKDILSGDKQYWFDFKAVDRRKLAEKVKVVNEAMKYISSNSVSQTNCLMKAGCVLIANDFGLRNLNERPRNTGKVFEPWWKRRLVRDVGSLRRSISVLDQKATGKLKREWKYKALDRKYGIRQKGLCIVLEELKQRLVVKKMKIRRYEQRVSQFRQNRLFMADQKKFYQQLSGDVRGEPVVPDADESVKFWEGIWSREVRHNEHAQWWVEMKDKVKYPRQENIVVNVEMVRQQCKKMSNWKTPGLDGVQGYWFKYFSVFHSRLARQFNELLNGEKEIPTWLTNDKTFLCPKDPKKGAAVDNFRPISCLPVMWKLLTGVVTESLTVFLEENDVIPLEQKGCKRGSRGTKDQLLIDKLVLKDSKKRHTIIFQWLGWIIRKLMIWFPIHGFWNV